MHARKWFNAITALAAGVVLAPAVARAAPLANGVHTKVSLAGTTLKITGDRGYDWGEGTCGEDVLDGGNDDDQIIAADELWGNMDCPAAVDTINCGSGADGADVDPIDVTKNCESVAGPY